METYSSAKTIILFIARVNSCRACQYSHIMYSLSNKEESTSTAQHTVSHIIFQIQEPFNSTFHVYKYTCSCILTFVQMLKQSNADS